jgi:hypothetical protein
MGELAELVAEFAPRLQSATGLAYRAFQPTLSEFCTAVRTLSHGVDAEVADGLRGLLADRDPIRITLWLHCAMTRPSAGLVAPLCDLLLVGDRYLQHEWIADLLGEMGDPRAVDALSQTCSFDVSGDAFRSLPKRCLQALAAIGTREAMAAIEVQLSSPWVEVREEAAHLLGSGGAQDS